MSRGVKFLAWCNRCQKPTLLSMIEPDDSDPVDQETVFLDPTCWYCGVLLVEFYYGGLGR
jgi:hypothetical protein